MRLKLHVRRYRYCYALVFTTAVLAVFKLSANSEPYHEIEVHRIGQGRPEVTKIPRILHIMWCGNRTFDFKNYLSVLSSTRFARPESVRFYFYNLPLVDRYEYHTWFREWTTSTRNIRQVKVKQDVCLDENTKLKFARKLLHVHGGVYVGHDTVFTRRLDLEVEYEDRLISSYEGYSVSMVGGAKGTTVKPTAEIGFTRCISDDDFRNISEDEQDPGYFCAYSPIVPRDLLLDRPADRLITLSRILFYDNDGTLPKAEPHTHPIVPNIAHQLWLSGSPMDFLFYLSSMSLIHVVKVDRLYIYGERIPGGKYWRLLERNDKVTFISIPRPDTAYNRRTGDPRLASDIFRSDVLLKYGGIYSDVDVIWTRRPPALLWHYEAVASLDWAHSFPPYPDYMNLGVAMACDPNFKSRVFWKQYADSLRDLREDTFGYNGLLQPYKIYERHPQSVLVDDHLQVMCFREKCYPRWGQRAEDITWATDTSAFHWTWPTPKEFADLRTLLKSRGQWAEIGQLVMCMAKETVL